MSNAQKYFGKYRGMVVTNVDPMQTGRLMVQVPDVAGIIPGTWALPCFPFTGPQMGFWALPQIGSGVWVEFEQGDPDHPSGAAAGMAPPPNRPRSPSPRRRAYPPSCCKRRGKTPS